MILEEPIMRMQRQIFITWNNKSTLRFKPTKHAETALVKDLLEMLKETGYKGDWEAETECQLKWRARKGLGELD